MHSSIRSTRRPLRSRLALYALAVFFAATAAVNVAQAEVIWVGDSVACDIQSRAVPTIGQAMGVALLNSDADDEIRLTAKNTNYTGNAGFYTIANWSGHLTFRGGYSDCGVTSATPARIGYHANPVFTVNNSTVTFKDLQMRQSGSRGLVVDDDSAVFLVDVGISANQSGIEVKGGSYVEIDGSSTIVGNTDASTAKGGGIYCHDGNSTVTINGTVRSNKAVKGGNLFVETGCSAKLGQKSSIINGVASDAGGGILVDNGGQLRATGGAELVVIKGNTAVNGGGLFVWGTGRAILNNTHLENNHAADKGAAIFSANGGGAAIQVQMDRVDDCPFLISCSEIKGHNYFNSLVYAYNSNVDISRTIVDQNSYVGDYGEITGMFHATNSAKFRLNRVAMIRNDAWYLLDNYILSTIEVTHATVARNKFTKPGQSTADSWIAYDSFQGSLNIQNSVFIDTKGIDDRFTSPSTTFGDCNLIDNSFGWPTGSYSIGTPQFISVDTGDMRQVASSPGVDMCNRDDFGWSTEKDLENQLAPVNENTNPQGHPGQTGGLYDAGADEVYDNIGDDMFLLTVQKIGSGSGAVISSPLGIACGGDCTEVYFKGTVVALTAVPATGSVFAGWQICPFVRLNNQCATTMQSSQTVEAVFQPSDLIFENGFD